MTYEKITQQLGVFWPCYSEDPQTGAAIDDHPGTPRLFERGSYNPVAKGQGPFYFPDGRARFNVAEYRPPVDDASEEYPIYLTTGRVVSQFLSGTQTRRIGPLVKQYAEPRHRNASAARRQAGDCRRRLGHRGDTARHDHVESAGRDHHPPGHRLHPVSLAGPEECRTS